MKVGLNLIFFQKTKNQNYLLVLHLISLNTPIPIGKPLMRKMPLFAGKERLVYRPQKIIKKNLRIDLCGIP
jgi:hypothetical protein